MSASSKQGQSAPVNRLVTLAVRGSLMAGMLAMASCGGGSSSSNVAPTGVTMSGRVMGGQQPVVGALVTIYLAGSGGLGSQGTTLATATTDGNGTFTFSGVSCPTASDPPVYAVATGGNAGSGTNAALALSAGLGSCSSLTGVFININEVTTVASVWALSQFLDPTGQSLGTIGADTTHSGFVGLRNAAANIANLADVTAGQAMTEPVSGAFGTSPGATVNALANILATCVNSNGATTGSTPLPPCGQLFAAATPPGSSTAPATTLQAALNIARNPSNSPGTLFGLMGTNGPFQTPQPLQSAPADWTLVIEFTGGTGLDSNQLPAGLAIDAMGDLVVSNAIGDFGDGTGSILALNPQGVQEGQVATGGAGPEGLAFDSTGNLWSANETANTVSGLDSGLNPLPGSPFSGAAATPLTQPANVAIDAQDNVWISGGESSTVTELSKAGGYAASAATFQDTNSAGASAWRSFAFDPSGNAWLGDAGSSDIMELPGGTLDATPVFFDSTMLGAAALPGLIGSIASDASGNIWSANVSPAGTGVSELVKGASGYTGVNFPLNILGGVLSVDIAIDGAGKPWLLARSPSVYCVVPMDTSGNYLASTADGANGCLGSASLRGDTMVAHGFLIDSSGNVWTLNSAAEGVFEVVGVAVPVTTPKLGYARPLS